MLKKILTKYKGMSPAVRTSVWFTICNFLQRGMALITVPIFTRILTTSQFGVCNVYFAWFDILMLFTSLRLHWDGLNNGLIRNEEDKDGYTSSIAGLIIVMTLAECLICLLFKDFFLKVTGFNGILMGFILIHLLLNPGLYLWMNRERFDFRYRWPALATMFCTVISPVVSITAVMLTPYKAEARILGNVVVQSISGIICYWILFRKGRKFYDRKYWAFALRFNLPLIFYYLSETVLNQADRLMIASYVGKSEAGFYSVAYTASTLMLLMVSGVNGSFAPWMYKKLKAGLENEIKNVAAAICLIVAAAVLAMTAFAPLIVRILATEEYYDAIWIIPAVSASVFFVFLYTVFANIEMYYSENRMISVISIIASAANVGLNALCIPRFGYMAAGWTTLTCYILLALMHYVLYRKALRKHGVGEILPEGRILGIAVVVVVLSFVMLFTYRFGMARYVILLIEGGLAYLFRDKIKGLIGDIRQK